MMSAPERSSETDLPAAIGSVAICSRPLPLARTASRPLTALRIFETAKMIPITTIRAMMVRTIPDPLPPAEAACAAPEGDRRRGVCSPVAPVAARAMWAYESVRAPIGPAPRVNVENRIEGSLRGKRPPLCRPIGPGPLGRMPDFWAGAQPRRGGRRGAGGGLGQSLADRLERARGRGRLCA